MSKEPGSVRRPKTCLKSDKKHCVGMFVPTPLHVIGPQLDFEDFLRQVMNRVTCLKLVYLPKV